MSAIALHRGTRLRLSGLTHTVERLEAHRGVVVLRRGSDSIEISLEELAHHPHLSSDTHDRSTAQALLPRLTSNRRSTVEYKLAHVLEALTGYRSGDARHPLPGEPRPAYHPDYTTLTERREAKAIELDNEFARRAGVRMTARTIRRWQDKWQREHDIEAVIDHRLVPDLRGFPSVCAHVAAAIAEVVADLKNGSTITITAIQVRTLQRIVADQGEDYSCHIPSRQTFARFLRAHWPNSQWSGKASSRQSSVEAPPEGFSPRHATRLGEYVHIDTHKLKVLLASTVFEGAVEGSLVLAVDELSLSLVSIRVVEGAESAQDVALALTDMARPRAMMSHWPDDARWPFVGLPESVFYSNGSTGPLCGRPVVNPETIIEDNGSTYRAYQVTQAAHQLGTSVLPARPETPTDKPAVEHAFSSILHMLCQYLQGYKGRDITERGRYVDHEVKWTAQELEDIITLWAVRVWQTHHVEGLRPPDVVEGNWSPNAVYQDAIETGGFAPRLMSSNDYYDRLRSHFCVISSRGVKVGSLHYDDPALSPLRGTRSLRGGAHPGKWLVKSDRRDLRQVYLLGPSDEYLTLKWNGLTEHTPAFNDRHALRLQRILRTRGVGPLSPSELREILVLEVLPSGDEARTRHASKAAADAEKAATDRTVAGITAPAPSAAEDDLEGPEAPRRSATPRSQSAAAAPGKPEPAAPARVAARLGSRRTSIFNPNSDPGSDPDTDTDVESGVDPGIDLGTDSIGVPAVEWSHP